jgi:hypothetical protein
MVRKKIGFIRAKGSGKSPNKSMWTAAVTFLDG